MGAVYVGVCAGVCPRAWFGAASATPLTPRAPSPPLLSNTHVGAQAATSRRCWACPSRRSTRLCRCAVQKGTSILVVVPLYIDAVLCCGCVASRSRTALRFSHLLPRLFPPPSLFKRKTVDDEWSNEVHRPPALSFSALSLLLSLCSAPLFYAPPSRPLSRRSFLILPLPRPSIPSSRIPPLPPCCPCPCPCPCPFRQAIFGQILIGVTDFDVFMQMMREGKKGNRVSHK